MAEHAGASPRRPRSPRIRGVDLARGFALLGMLAVHVGPTGVGGIAGRLYASPHGRASILFGLVAGVSVSLLARSRAASPAAARLRLVWRAAVLLPVGLVLQELDHGVLVILQDYAVLFLLAVLVLTLDDRWLLGLAAVTAMVGPVVFLWGQMTAPGDFSRAAVTVSDDPGEIVHGLVLSGPYPLITWAAPFLLGMWLGRRDLRSPRVRARLMVGGGTLAVLAFATSRALIAALGDATGPPGWDQLVIDTPHSQMPLWLLDATGCAVFVLGVALVVADVARHLTWPLVAVGQLALTIYVGHLLVLHLAREALTSDAVGGAVLSVAAFSLAAAALATGWRATFSRGPLEALLHAPWQGLQEGRSRDRSHPREAMDEPVSGPAPSSHEPGGS